jgi:myo-inositol-1(or 4)-monophosphatase
VAAVSPEDLLAVFDDVVGEVRAALGGLDDWGPSGGRDGQYRHDVLADGIAVRRLAGAGVRVLSEESGMTGTGELTVVVDPIDGSTNASLGLPWYAASLCAVDREGPLCALVENLATGERFQAVRGAGATGGGLAVRPSTVVDLGDAVIGFSGWPPRRARWRQYRALGAAALDVCAVAAGRLDGYVDCDGAHGVWDYLGAMLVCREAGAAIADGHGRDLVVLDPLARRTPVAAATPELLDELLRMQRWASSPAG